MLAAPAAANPPIHINLAERVPARWIDERTDEWPLTPERWRQRMPPECQTRGGYRRFCQGERRVPTPSETVANFARRLGLGHRATALQLMSDRPFPEWLALVSNEDGDERLEFPVEGGRLGRGFGQTRTGVLSERQHPGIDIGAPEGASIFAARGGLVVYSDNELTGFGNVVMLLHREGVTTFYAHCRATFVVAGERVERGQRIAEVGQTGFAGGPHLHFEWRERGWPRDPTPHFRYR